MSPQRSLHMLAALLAAAAAVRVAAAFNIDMSEPKVYAGEQQDFFGYKVLQFTSGSSKGIVVTSPLRQNGSGGISRPSPDQKWFSPKEWSVPTAAAVVKHLGMSVAADSTGSHFTVCSANVEHECYENSYLNSICYNLTEQLHRVSSFSPAFQNCTKKSVDLLFLFDGSQSMTTEEFDKNKDFILDIMKHLRNTSIKFAAVQFSSNFSKVFDFNDYAAGRAKEKLKKEVHLKSLTNTHKALTFVLHDLFENPEAGASADATKVLVLITDGDPSDTDRNNTVQKYNAKNVIRFVIGVKAAKLDKFQDIASQPTKQYAFKIEEYSGLTGVLENFQKKIFTMEGSTAARAGNMKDEMSQSGFSSIFYQDKLILGSVGSNSWKGSLLERQGLQETQIEDPEMKMDSYMGYSVSAGGRNGAVAYFTGAPRAEHMGWVVRFRHDGRKWTVAQRLSGEQIGSYFGAELCSVDVDSDGNTDFLLVSAPQFYLPQDAKEGRLYVYKLTKEMALEEVAMETAPSTGRFGSSIASLADLNGDGLRDVAVGAPLEDEQQGVVYIYLGDRERGLRSTYSQRIMGATVNPGRKFFGQAISGLVDLGEDGLPDLVVGSQGAAVVLRSKPVFNVTAHMTFDPEQISTHGVVCPNGDGSLPMVDLHVCFHVAEATASLYGAGGAALSISLVLDVDPKRQKSRGFFIAAEKKSRNVTMRYELTEAQTCFNFSVLMPRCVEDIVSPVDIRLKFSQIDTAFAITSLNTDSVRSSTVEVPFERQCRKNDSCEAELQVDFIFGSATLLVAKERDFTVSVTLENRGDDSYNTSLTLRYPLGLSFSWMTPVKVTRPTLIKCYLKGALDRTVCGVSLPIYRSRSSATFNASFLFVSDYDWNDTATLTVEANSDNSNSTVSLTRSIPVQFEVKMVLTVKEDSVSYLNFTSEDPAPKRLLVQYQVDNTGSKDFPVNVSLIFPTQLHHGFSMTNFQLHHQQNQTSCTSVSALKNQFCSEEKHCIVITCDTFALRWANPAHFTLSGDVSFRELETLAASLPFLKRYTGDGGQVTFSSILQVDYDSRRFALDPENLQKKGADPEDSWRQNRPTVKRAEVRVEFIIPPDQRLITLTGAGLGVLLLVIITIVMFKLGCFKRKKPEDYEDQMAKASTRPDPAPDHEKPDGKPLLSAGGENGGPPPDEKTNLDLD
ncbi:unnamed protein product [Ophioblennius macclurei]